MADSLAEVSRLLETGQVGAASDMLKRLQAAIPEPGAPAAPAPRPSPRELGVILLDLLTAIVMHHGNPPALSDLLQEYTAVLTAPK